MKGIIAFIICLCLLSCHSAKKNAEEIQVLVLRGPSSIAFASWMENPPSVNGRKVVIHIADSPDQVVASMVKGEADITVLPMINAANLYNKEVPYFLAGCPIWGNLYLIGRTNATQMYVFGSGTTPDILTRYYIEKNELSYKLNYTLGTASEVVRGFLGGKVEASVLGEPFVSMVLQRDSTIHILADLNNPTDTSPGFAETAIMIRQSLSGEKDILNQYLKETCRFADEQPEDVVAVLEKRQVFPNGMLTPEAIKRSRIMYLTAEESTEEIRSFLEIINQYEPRAIGGKLPDEKFYN